MKYYPVCLDVRDRDCLVVGGGAVAARKVRTLVDCGARVTVVSPCFADNLRELADPASVRLIERPYKAADIAGRFLVIGATDDAALNRRISADAERENILCNIADVPDACSFILPSVIDRGDLIVAVSTSGKSPAFARRLRKSLENYFGEEYREFLRLMGAIRKKLLAEEHAPEAHKPLFEALIDRGLFERVRDGKTSDIDCLLGEVLGEGYDYETLMQFPNEKGQGV